MTRVFDIDEVRAAVGATTFGGRLHYRSVVDSTNRVARDLLLEMPANLAVFTDFQEAGKGRRGRTWIAPAGSSLLLSVGLKIPPRARPADMSMLGSVAAASALHDETGLRLELKWPNDVLLGNRKVAGILAESVPSPAGTFAIIGIGVNVNFDPESVEGIPESATSVLRALGRPVPIESLAIRLLQRVSELYRDAFDHPDSVYSAWKEQLVTLGRKVAVHEASGTWVGTAMRVDRDGGLEVIPELGASRIVHAADVSVRAD